MKNKLKNYYGDYGCIIINTDEGDVVINVDIDFLANVKVGDKVCLCTYEEKNNIDVEVIKAEWLRWITNYNGKDEFDDDVIYEIFADAAIVIEDRWFNSVDFTCFGEINDDDKARLNQYLKDRKPIL